MMRMFLGLFYINKDKNVKLMGPDNTFIHIFFATAIVVPSFGYMGLCCWRIIIQTLSLLFMHNEKWFTVITLGIIDRDKFYRNYIAQDVYEDKRKAVVEDSEKGDEDSHGNHQDEDDG